MIHKVVKYLLENDSAFATAIGTDGQSKVKIYPILAPQGVAPPFCTYELTGLSPSPTKEDTSGADFNSFNVRVYDYEFEDVMDLADKARAAIDKATAGTYNGVTLLYLDFVTMNDGYMRQDEILYYLELEFEAITR